MSIAEDCAERFKNLILEEFANKHLSGNLSRSVRLYKIDSRRVAVSIKPESYNVAEYIKNHILITYPTRSYAQQLNATGSKISYYYKGSTITKQIGNHQNFIETNLKKAVEETIKSKKGAKIEKWNIHN